MKYVIEVNWSGMNDITEKLYSAVRNKSTEYGTIDFRSDPEFKTSHSVVHLNESTVALVNKIFPFIEPTLVFIELGGKGYLTPHIDGAIEWGYPYNLVMPMTDVSNTRTVYFENTDLCFNEKWKTTGSVHMRDYTKLNPVFEFTFNGPTVFFNQQLHTMFNDGPSPVVVGTWKLFKDVTPFDIIQWAEKNSVTVKEIF